MEKVIKAKKWTTCQPFVVGAFIQVDQVGMESKDQEAKVVQKEMERKGEEVVSK